MTDFVQSNYNTDSGSAYPLNIDQGIGALYELSGYVRRSYAPNPFFQVDQLANSATAVADDVYGHDHWFALTQTASIQVSTQTLQENGQPTNARLNQNQAAAQRFGYACIIEAAEAQKYRGQVMTFRPRVRISNSQTVRCAVLEWTGTADIVTSDIVNDWTLGTFSAGNFFIAAGIGGINLGTATPGANTWADVACLATINNNVNNLILFVWMEATAAQNFTLDLGKMCFVQGTKIGEIYLPTYEETLRYAMRFYEHSFNIGTAPAQNAGNGAGSITIFRQGVAAATSTSVFFETFKNVKRKAPVVTTYNPQAANPQVRNVDIGADCTLVAPTGMYKGFSVTYTTAGGSASSNNNGLYWAADARL